mmetsp:Transcript_90022/g.254970  ORF Transcript_90022/g.254970 Transcript_90022/m.254970 type:complete len:87 (-) Transcript_90022:28-288(-)
MQPLPEQFWLAAIGVLLKYRLSVWLRLCLQERVATLGLGLATLVSGLELLGGGLRTGQAGRKTKHDNATQYWHHRCALGYRMHKTA